MLLHIFRDILMGSLIERGDSVPVQFLIGILDEPIQAGEKNILLGRARAGEMLLHKVQDRISGKRRNQQLIIFIQKLIALILLH